jgi:hypothetical protein
MLVGSDRMLAHAFSDAMFVELLREKVGGAAGVFLGKMGAFNKGDGERKFDKMPLNMGMPFCSGAWGREGFLIRLFE